MKKPIEEELKTLTNADIVSKIKTYEIHSSNQSVYIHYSNEELLIELKSFIQHVYEHLNSLSNIYNQIANIEIEINLLTNYIQGELERYFELENIPMSAQALQSRSHINKFLVLCKLIIVCERKSLVNMDIIEQIKIYQNHSSEPHSQNYSRIQLLAEIKNFIFSIYQNLKNAESISAEQVTNMEKDYVSLNQYLTVELGFVLKKDDIAAEEVIQLQQSIYKYQGLIKNFITQTELKSQLKNCQIKIKKLKHKSENNLYSKLMKNPIITSSSALSKFPAIQYTGKIAWFIMAGFGLIIYSHSPTFEDKTRLMGPDRYLNKSQVRLNNLTPMIIPISLISLITGILLKNKYEKIKKRYEKLNTALNRTTEKAASLKDTIDLEKNRFRSLYPDEIIEAKLSLT